jgi:peptidoglycan hydrolase-like protein with peptidoglycan-binding domain
MIPTLFPRIPSDPRTLQLSGSVGRSGRNVRADVTAVQSILNATRPFAAPQTTALTVDGLVGPKTIGAIERFQYWNRSAVDGRMDPRGPAILSAVSLLEERRAMPAPMPGLEQASSRDVAAFTNAGALAQSAANTLAPTSGQVTHSNGFGVPFTATAFVIRKATTVELTLARGGVFMAILEIEDEVTRRIHKVDINAGLLAASPKWGLPVGIDVSLPALKSEGGRLHRGPLPFGITRASLFGAIGVTLLGGNLPSGEGGGIALYQFQWSPAPPGTCSAWAVMAGQQFGIPGVSVASGPGLAMPL